MLGIIAFNSSLSWDDYYTVSLFFMSKVSIAIWLGIGILSRTYASLKCIQLKCSILILRRSVSFGNLGTDFTKS